MRKKNTPASQQAAGTWLVLPALADVGPTLVPVWGSEVG